MATTHRFSRFLQLLRVKCKIFSTRSQGQSHQDRPDIHDQSLLLDLFTQSPQALVVKLGFGEEVGSDDDLEVVRAR